MAVEFSGQMFAGHEILAKLGRGGMGTVYKARQPMLDRLVAVKILPGHLAGDPQFVARFQREARAAGSLDHPNLVKVYSAGESEGIHYIAMEFVEGETLQARLDRDGRLEAEEALALTVFVAEALKHAWNEARIVHRDIKPDNIFLSKNGGVKVGDLGLAKSVGGETLGLTETGAAMGTPHYISPEQARGDRNIDCRSDIYSLGCTLFHMLTGRTPYEGENSMAVMHKHIHDPAPAILKAWPQCPMPLVLLAGKMLKKHPSQRHQNYDELINNIQRLVDKLHQTASLPAGVVTMMFTDIVNSTRLKVEMVGGTAMERDGAYAQMIKQPHDIIVRRCVASAAGHLVKSTGDGFFLAFSDAEAAVVCAMNIQREMAAQPIPTPLGLLQVRIGMHTGSASASEGDYAAATADKAARVAGQAGGGQVLLSRQTHALAESIHGAVFQRVGPVTLKGIGGAEHLYAVGTEPAAPPGVQGIGTAARRMAPMMPWVAALLVLAGGFAWWAPWKRPRPTPRGAPPPQVAETTREVRPDSSGEIPASEPLPSAENWQDWMAEQRRAGSLPGGWSEEGSRWVSARERLTMVIPAVMRDGAVRATFPIMETRCALALRWSGKGCYKLAVGRENIDLEIYAPDMSLLKRWPLPTGVDLKSDVTAEFRAVGNEFSVKLNGELIGRVHDATFREGMLNIYVPLQGTRISRIEVLNLDGAPDVARLSAPEGGAVLAANFAALRPQMNPAVDESFVRDVAGLPAGEQVARVVARLKELNPDFDAAGATHQIENGRVVDLRLSAVGVTNISPVRALADLQRLECKSYDSGRLGALEDLSPLRGLALTMLACDYTRVHDLSPLAGMPLKGLYIPGTAVHDVSPLRGMALARFSCIRTAVSDLSPLQGMPLEQLNCGKSKVGNISPLAGMPLILLQCAGAAVTDLSPMKDLPLTILQCDFKTDRDAAIMRSIKTLYKINDLPAAEFWKRVDAGEEPQVAGP